MKTFIAMPVSEECCQSKEVGGKLYMLLKDRKVDPTKFGCISECLYMTKGSLAKFCFAKGELKVECKDDELDAEEHATTNTTLDFETTITTPMVTTGLLHVCASLLISFESLTISLLKYELKGLLFILFFFSIVTNKPFS